MWTMKTTAKNILVALGLMAVAGQASFGGVSGWGMDAPRGYAPAMLSNGRVCMTADFLGGVPPRLKSTPDEAA